MPKIGGSSAKKGLRKPRFAANGNRLPDPLPYGLILTDVTKNKWRLGRAVGLGGFGEIYLVSNGIRKILGSDGNYVVKIEPHKNGPLFTEMHFYHRVGKTHQIEAWMKKKKLNFLGMPKFIASGSHIHKGMKYRFMVLERFGEDLQKLLDRNNKMFPVKTVYTLGKIILDILEYVHSHGYIHADVKASNLLMGPKSREETEVYLIDYGLACRYRVQGSHKELKEDMRKAHDGTLEFTSRDAHIGAHSRRGDLEILGYNMLQWLAGFLPWDEHLKDPEAVSRQKSMYLSNISSLIKNSFPNTTAPRGIMEYFSYVARLKFEEEPDYQRCKDILSSGIRANGFKDDGKLLYTSQNATRKSVKRPASRERHSCSPSSKVVKRHMPLEASPQRKLRRVASATPSLQSSRSPQPAGRHPHVMDNPTPAMLLVMQNSMARKMRLQSEKKAAGILKEISIFNRKKYSLHKPKGPSKISKAALIASFKRRLRNSSCTQL